MSQTITTSECLSLLRENDNFLLLTHRSPDGDTVGSAAALCHLLRALGKTAYLLDNSDLTDLLRRFVDGMIAPESYAPQYIVAVDIAGTSLLPSNAAAYAEVCDLCVDHHDSNRHYARNTLLCVAAACGEVVYDLFAQADMQLTVPVAECLYLALSTDTGCFRYPSVTAKTMRIGAACIDTGIDFYTINREFLEMRSRKRIEVESAAINRCCFSRDGRFAYVALDNDALKEFGASDEEMSEIATLLRSIEGVDLSVFMREKTRGSWRISSRSAPTVDCSAVLSHIGGGGHRCAAGATATLSIDGLLNALMEAVSIETDIELR